METTHNGPMRPRPRTPEAPPEADDARRDARRELWTDARVAIRAVLRPTEGEREIYGWVHNLSAGGMFVRVAEGLAPDTECHVRLVWKDGPVFRAAFLKGWAVYGTEQGLGVQFEEPTDEVRDVLRGLDRRHASPAA